jgi:hypothetical protein
MSIDLGSPALEVAIGLAFVFFLLSLIVSAGTEAVAWVFKLRAKTLVTGVERLLGDQRISDALLSHPLVQSDVTTPVRKRRPSYLSARNFALALVQILRQEGRDAVGALKQVEAGIDGFCSDSPLGAQLRALLEDADTSMVRFRGATERWFDDGMDRVSGWYKRKSQLVTIVIAVVVAIGLNASAVRIAERLINEPTVRAAVVSNAEKALLKPGEEEGSGGSLTAAGKQAEGAVEEVDSLELPILWSAANDPFSSWDAGVVAAAGWLITVLAISLGAPFWFDALGKLANLRTTGKKPGVEK